MWWGRSENCSLLYGSSTISTMGFFITSTTSARRERCTYRHTDAIGVGCHTLKTMAPTEASATVSKGRDCSCKMKNWTSTTSEGQAQSVSCKPHTHTHTYADMQTCSTLESNSNGTSPIGPVERSSGGTRRQLHIARAPPPTRFALRLYPLAHVARRRAVGERGDRKHTDTQTHRHTGTHTLGLKDAATWTLSSRFLFSIQNLVRCF